MLCPERRGSTQTCSTFDYYSVLRVAASRVTEPQVNECGCVDLHSASLSRTDLSALDALVTREQVRFK